jgi:hypothetical protein
MITSMGGNANVVKKAVAPAIRNGSFFNSSAKDSRSRSAKWTTVLAFAFMER